VLDFLRSVRPRATKTLDPGLIGPIHEATGNLVVYRPYWNDHDQEEIIASMDVGRMVARVLQDVRSEWRQPWLYVEGLNETFGTASPPERIERIVQLECEFARQMAAHGLKTVLLNVPVGNIEPEQVAQYLLPVARVCRETRSAIGYHAYWWANPDTSGLASWWKWHAGRALELWDPVFRQHGYMPLYFFGEAGACGSRDGYALDPGGGWKHPGCYNGDWGRYLNDIAEFQRRLREWCARYGDRVLGSALFTTNAWNGWEYFLILEPQFPSLASIITR
jgi:hypothetical protein